MTHPRDAKLVIEKQYINRIDQCQFGRHFPFLSPHYLLPLLPLHERPYWLYSLTRNTINFLLTAYINTCTIINNTLANQRQKFESANQKLSREELDVNHGSVLEVRDSKNVGASTEVYHIAQSLAGFIYCLE